MCKAMAVVHKNDKKSEFKNMKTYVASFRMNGTKSTVSEWQNLPTENRYFATEVQMCIIKMMGLKLFLLASIRMICLKLMYEGNWTHSATNFHFSGVIAP